MGAVSIPLDELEWRLRGATARSTDSRLLAWPCCALAPEAVRMLRAHGYVAKHLKDGLPSGLRPAAM